MVGLRGVLRGMIPKDKLKSGGMCDSVRLRPDLGCWFQLGNTWSTYFTLLHLYSAL